MHIKLGVEQGDQIGRIFRTMGDCLLWVDFRKLHSEVARILGLLFATVKAMY
jgi:hypothetical protein